MEALFDADRASLLTTVVLRVIGEFSIDTDQLHNDSTSISVHGVYRDAVGTPRGSQPTNPKSHSVWTSYRGPSGKGGACRQI